MSVFEIKFPSNKCPNRKLKMLWKSILNSIVGFSCKIFILVVFYSTEIIDRLTNQLTGVYRFVWCLCCGYICHAYMLRPEENIIQLVLSFNLDEDSGVWTWFPGSCRRQIYLKRPVAVPWAWILKMWMSCNNIESLDTSATGFLLKYYSFLLKYYFWPSYIAQGRVLA